MDFCASTSSTVKVIFALIRHGNFAGFEFNSIMKNLKEAGLWLTCTLELLNSLSGFKGNMHSRSRHQTPRRQGECTFGSEKGFGVKLAARATCSASSSQPCCSCSFGSVRRRLVPQAVPRSFFKECWTAVKDRILFDGRTKLWLVSGIKLWIYFEEKQSFT